MKEVKADELSWEKGGGLIPVVVQDVRTGLVLMLGYMNREAFTRTVQTGRVTFFSRTRDSFWTKGETSGNHLSVEEIHSDCDGDTLLILALPAGPTCHTGTRSCFEAFSGELTPGILARLAHLIAGRRVERPAGSYTTRLFDEGINKIAQKLGEEAVETVVSMNQSKERTVEEAADLIYHLLVFLTEREVEWEDVLQELANRHVTR